MKLKKRAEEPDTVDPDAPADIGPREEAEPRTIKGSNNKVKLERDRCFNTLRYTAGVLSDFSFHRLSLGITILNEPVRHQFGVDLVRCKTVRGLLEWWRDETEGQAAHYLVGVWAALQDPAQLYTLGFCEWQEGMPEWYFCDDDYIARKLFAVAMALTGQRLLTINLAKVTLPFMFSRLLHEVGKNEAPNELRKIFVVLEFYERAAQTDMVFCRESGGLRRNRLPSRAGAR